MTICANDVGMEWMSNISVAGGSRSGGTTFEIMWDRDSDLPMMPGGNYMVVFQELGGMPPGPIRTLSPVSSKQ